MEIVQAQDGDMDEIISLLKVSLGEALMPKSETYFIWKHIQNPFGKSIIFLAKEQGKIVGIRTFMRWTWVNDTDTVNSVRAVDTATHPNFQGKGIFSKLTMRGVETAMQENVGFVFNTPNPISMIGYLKLGWYSTGKLPLHLRWGSLIPKMYNSIKVQSIYDDFSVRENIMKLNSGWKIQNYTDLMQTPISLQYLKWRYNDCPVAEYGAIIEPGQFGIIFRLKKLNRFIELRICEIWTEDQTSQLMLNRSLKALIQKIRPLIVTCVQSPLIHSKNKLPEGFYGPFKKGPVVTLRHLALNNLNIFEKFSKWSPSLGSMELF